MNDFEREKKLALEVSNGINMMCFNRKEFCKAMAREHRTLQADFTQLCFEWLKTCRENYESGNYDGRNELECNAAKIMLDKFEKGE